MWFSVDCTLIDNNTRHYSGQNLLWTHSAVHNSLTTVMMHVVGDNTTDHAKPHSIC